MAHYTKSHLADLSGDQRVHAALRLAWHSTARLNA